MSKESKYDIWVTGLDEDGEPHTIKVDWYAIVENQTVTSAVEHCLKKGFKMGERSGGKTYAQDLDDMIWSLEREKKQKAMVKKVTDWIE